MAACAACCACNSSPSELERYCGEVIGHGVEVARDLRDLVAAVEPARATARSPRPMRRTAWPSTDSGRTRRVVSAADATRPSRNAASVVAESAPFIRSAS